jgi:hypothetical protein
MTRFGFSGIKLGDAKQATRLFDFEDVLKVEQRSGEIYLVPNPIPTWSKGQTNPLQTY